MTPQEINARIDEAIKETTDKFEALRKEFNKPEYEVGAHYIAKCARVDSEYLIKLDLITETGFRAKYYIYDGNFINGGFFDSIERKATSTELLEALKKEVIKRGLVAGAKIKQGHYTIPNNAVYNLSLGCLYIDNVIIMDSNGYWAEVVKYKATSEYVNEYLSRPNVDLMEFLDSNNLKIVPNA